MSHVRWWAEPTLRGLAEDAEKIGTVAFELRAAHAFYFSELFWGFRLYGGDVSQDGVVENDVGRQRLAFCNAGAPASQRFEQTGIWRALWR